MIPFLTYPLALIALATVPALTAIYLLRNRFRRRQVSSLVLWQFQTPAKAGGAKIHRLQLPFLFFLELLILTLLVVAATGPHWQLPQAQRPLIVVLDDSFSLRAQTGGLSAQSRAHAYLQKLFRQQAPPSTRLILAGPQPRSLGAIVKSWSEVESQLAQWHCLAPDANLDTAITLAAELGKQQANILVLTDHQPPEPKITNPRLQWQACGEPLENAAIINASRTAFGAEDRCLLEIANDSAAPKNLRVAVQTGTNAPQASLLSLGAHESQRLVFNLPANAPLLTANLEADALADDNSVQLLPPIRKQVRVQVSLTNEAAAALVDRTLAATGLRAALNDNPEIVIHEGDTVPNTNAWSLNFQSDSATNAYTGPFIVDNTHPLAAGLGLAGVVWAGAATTNHPGDNPVILAGNIPLLSVREDIGSRRHLLLNFNPALSTVQSTPDWPVLFWNLLSWRIAELPGLKESNARLGSEVTLKTTGEAVQIHLPDATVTSFPHTGGELAIETPMPGLYHVVANGVTNQLAVNLFNPEKSDLAACSTGLWGKWSEDTEHRMQEKSAVWIFALLGLGLLGTHLYLIAKARS